MTTEDQKTRDLQGQIDELHVELERLRNEMEVLGMEDNVFQEIQYFPLLKVNKLIVGYLETTAANEPAILANQVILWKDTTNVKYYLKANFNGTAKKVELT